MYKGRLFTFGCSFTRYKWPTWADLLGQEFESYYNFGHSGGGNLFIACSIAEANARYKFTSEDTVLVMWTNATREDRYTNNWVLPGNIYTQSEYSEDFVKKFITIRGCYVRDLAQIHLAKNLLENSRCKFHFMSMVDMDNYSQYSVEKSEEILDLLIHYKDTINIVLPSAHKVIFNYDWWSRPMYENGPHRQDPHPMPLEHLEYINAVLPNYEFSEDSIRIAKILDLDVKNAFKTNGSFGSYDSRSNKWQQILKIKNSAVRF